MRGFSGFLFSAANTLQSRSEVGDFGNRKNSLEAVGLTQMRNDKAESMNIVQTGNIYKKVGKLELSFVLCIAFIFSRFAGLSFHLFVLSFGTWFLKLILLNLLLPSFVLYSLCIV